MSQLSRRVLLEFPATLTVTVVSNTRIDVAWSAVLGAASYRVYRNGVLTDSPTTEAVSATGLSGSTQYLFSVSCVDALAQEGPRSPTAPGTTFATPDTTAPTAPTISAGGATVSAVVISLVSPAVDTGSGIASYTLQRANNSAFTTSLVTTSGLTTFPLTVSGLLSGTQYFFRLQAVDVAGNVGPFSATVSATTQAAQSFIPIFPNWPMMNGVLTQGAGPGAADPDLAADKDVFAFQSLGYPTFARCDARVPFMLDIRAHQDTTKIQTRFFEYMTPCVTYKVNPNLNSNEREFNRELIDDPVNGHPDWIVKRVNGQECESLFGQGDDLQVNITTVAPRNSLNEDYATAYFKAHSNARTQAYKDLLSGIMHDVMNQRPALMYTNNGTIEVTDPDYDRDGIADIKTGFGPGAGNGGRMWAEGGLNTKAKFEARFPGKILMPNGARWEFDYRDGEGSPPQPTSAPFYRKWETDMSESVHNNLSFAPTSTGWTYSGSGGTLGRLQAFFRAYHVSEQFLKLDADVPPELGHAVYWFHTAGIARTPIAADILAHRFMSLCCLLVERGGIMINQASNQLSSLDETLIDLGNPLSARSMGTFTDPNDTQSFVMRDADVSVGIARFYIGEFEKGTLVVRGDAPTPGAYPSADAAVSCPLPSPGAGKKHQRFNAATYVNLRTGRRTRGQDTTLNSGADVVGNAVSLKPWHAQILLRVAV